MKGQTTAVLLPGLDGTGDLFESFVATAPAGLRPLVVRLPQLADYEQLTAAILQELPAEDTLLLVAESFSGPLALLLAANLPDRRVGVVLCNSFVQCPRPKLLRFIPWRLAFALRMPKMVATKWFLGNDASPQHVVALRQAIKKTPASVLAARIKSVTKLTLRGLKMLHVPVLYLRGTEDHLVPPAAAEAVAKALPNVQVVEIKGPHLLLQVEPENAWRSIRIFAVNQQLLSDS